MWTVRAAAFALLAGSVLVCACKQNRPVAAVPATSTDVVVAAPLPAEDSPTVPDEGEPIGAPPAEPAPVAPPPTPTAQAGEVLYGTYCALCHGRDRRGYAADNAPSLVSPTFLESATDAFLAESIALGRPGTAMAGYGAAIGGPLPPDQVQSLVLYLRSKGPAPRALVRRSAVGDPVEGESLYRAHCATCHGSVRQRGEAIHLYNPQFLASADDAYLRYAVDHGRPETRMPAWRRRLKPAHVDAILTHLRHSAPPLPVRPVADLPGLPTASGLAAGHSSSVADAPPPLPPTPKPTTPVVLNPEGRPPKWQLREGRFVSVDAVSQALVDERRLILLDARAPSDYALLHIVGAIVTPYYDKKALEVVPNDGTWVVAYCACPHHVSGEVVDELKRRGHKNAAVLDEGVFVWNARGYPVVKDPNGPEPPIPPPGFPFVQPAEDDSPRAPKGKAASKRHAIKPRQPPPP